MPRRVTDKARTRYSESDDPPHKIIIIIIRAKGDLKIMLSVAIAPKDITTRELTKRKQMGVYTVPTKGQRTASRKVTKRSIYKWEPTLYPLGPEVRIPTFSVPTTGQKRKPFGQYQNPK
jgi:hypothetical protein